MKKFTVDDCYSIQNNPLTVSEVLYYIPLQEDEYLQLLFNINFNILDKSFGYDNGLASFSIVSNGEEITRLNDSEEYRIVETDDGLKLLIVRVHGSVNGVNHYTNHNQLDMYSIFIIEKEVTYISSDYYEVEREEPSGIIRVTYGIKNICRAENARTARVKELKGLENPTPVEKYILDTLTTREYRLPRTIIVVDEMDYKSILITAVLSMMHSKNSPYKEKVYIRTTEELAGSEDNPFVLRSTDVVISTIANTVGQDIEVYDIDTAISFVNQLQSNLHDVESLDSDKVKTICDAILDRYLIKENITRDTVAIDVVSHLIGSYKDILEMFIRMIEVNSRNMDEMSTDIDRNLTGYVKDSLNSIVDEVIKTIDAFKNDDIDNNVVSFNEKVKDVINFKMFKTYLPFTVFRTLFITINRLKLFTDRNYVIYNYTTTDYGYIYSSVLTWLTSETVDKVKSGIGVENLCTYLDKYLSSRLRGVSTNGMKRHMEGDMEILTTDRFYKLSEVLNSESDILSDTVIENSVDEG